MKCKNFFLERKYKKLLRPGASSQNIRNNFILEKFKKFFNLGARKFHFQKYKKFFQFFFFFLIF